MLKRLFEPTTNRYYIQARVGLGFGTIALVIAGLNYLQQVIYYDITPWAAFLSPFTSILVLEGVLFLGSAIRESKMSQWLQVAFFIFNSFLNAATSGNGELTSGVYMVVALWLISTYGLFPRRLPSLVSVLMAPYFGLLALGFSSNATSGIAAFQVANSLTLVIGLGWIFYNLAGARIQERRQREQELEEKVQERTKQLQNLVDERGTIIREIHHRVKNNLQLTASLLRLGQSQASAQDPIEVYRASISRIQSIALVHERLYVDEQFGLVNLGGYVRELCQHLQQTYDMDVRTDLHFAHIDDVSLDFAVPFGLIMNELIGNAAEHSGENPSRNGHVQVSMRDSGKGLTLTVADDESSVPADFDPERDGSMGLQIVRSLVDQLRGSYVVETQRGLTWQLSFPSPPQKLTGQRE